MDVRRLDAGDIESVTEVFRETFAPAYISFSELAEGKALSPTEVSGEAHAIFQGQLRLLVDDPHCGYFVAVDGARIVGFALASLRRTEAGHFECWLDDICVAPSAQRRGAARALWERVQAWASDRDVDAFLLESGIRNERAHHFFEGLGFEPVATVFWRPGDGRVR